MGFIKKITLQDVVILGAIALIIWVGGNAVAAEINGTLNGFNGTF